MPELSDTDLEAQQKQTVATSETNSKPQEEAEKGDASEPKYEDKKSSSDINAVVDNELKLDKLDELSSLEQEIAKMHNIQHFTEPSPEDDNTKSQLHDTVGIAAENGNEKNYDVQQVKNDLGKSNRCTLDSKAHMKEDLMPTAALEEVDLIALLKGTDQEPEQPAESATDPQKSNIELALAELDNVGVTIEGEGQYEIMEIDDGDNVSGPSPELLTVASSSLSSNKTAGKYQTTVVGKTKLSPEQARAVALEQMADLKANKARRKESAASSVKQQQTAAHKNSLDIVTSLNNDWNEYDNSSDAASNSNSNANVTEMSTSKKSLMKKSKPTIEVPQMVGSVKVMLKSANPKAVEKPIPVAEQPNNGGESPSTTGFKRTRVIKRKIIWDPDVPETQKSFAQYASPKSNTNATTTLTTTTGEVATSPVSAAATKGSNSETAPKKARPSTPKEPTKVSTKRSATPAKLADLNVSSQPKRRSQTPSVPNGASSQGKKKKVTEIDKLMGDEGAANMMQAVEREQRELSGGEIPTNKPLMRKRALTLTGRPLKAAAAAAAGAAAAASNIIDGTTLANKKDNISKSSKRALASIAADISSVIAKSTKTRASDSWDYVYKQRASEESMIMRRRSNSSYSSNASVNRLSLDNKPNAVTSLSDDASEPSVNDPSFIFLKPENKANQRNDGSSSSQTLENDLKHGTLSPKVSKSAKVELVTLHKQEKVTQLIINGHVGKTGYTYKLQLLQKLSELLNKLAKSNDCNTVLLSVQGQQFCQGIDCQDLLAATLDKRKTNAAQFSSVLRTYLRTLATFPKPLVAGIVGNLKNLGVMQLPLFDYVLAADDCCFETNYAKLGQLPEGYALWQGSQKVSTQVHTRLFLMGERLHTSDVMNSSNCFIDKACKPSSVNEEALAVAKLISSSTAEHYRSLKKLNQTAKTVFLQRLEAEFKVISEQWSSANFQTNYKRYMNDPEF